MSEISRTQLALDRFGSCSIVAADLYREVDQLMIENELTEMTLHQRIGAFETSYAADVLPLIPQVTREYIDGRRTYDVQLALTREQLDIDEQAENNPPILLQGITRKDVSTPLASFSRRPYEDHCDYVQVRDQMLHDLDTVATPQDEIPRMSILRGLSEVIRGVSGQEGSRAEPEAFIDKPRLGRVLYDNLELFERAQGSHFVNDLYRSIHYQRFEQKGPKKLLGRGKYDFPEVAIYQTAVTDLYKDIEPWVGDKNRIGLIDIHYSYSSTRRIVPGGKNPNPEFNPEVYDKYLKARADLRAFIERPDIELLKEGKVMGLERFDSYFPLLNALIRHHHFEDGDRYHWRESLISDNGSARRSDPDKLILVATDALEKQDIFGVFDEELGSYHDPTESLLSKLCGIRVEKVTEGDIPATLNGHQTMARVRLQISPNSSGTAHRIVHFAVPLSMADRDPELAGVYELDRTSSQKESPEDIEELNKLFEELPAPVEKI